MACAAQSTAFAMLASSKTMLAPLPPNSKLTGVKFAAAAPAITFPVELSPVKVIRSTRWSRVSASPTESGP